VSAAPVRAERSANGSGGVNRHYNPDIDIFVVCSGNLCRSPMAEALLRRRLAERGVEARVASSGRTAPP
jgi:hypothetical protein